KDLNIEKSKRLFSRAIDIIPGGSQTNSLRPQGYAFGAYPIYFERGVGSHVWDVDGNEYIDYICHAGPIILGHSYPRVVEAVKEQLEKMTVSPLLHPLEVEVAEEIIKTVPCAEMVRFLKTGGMACDAAVRTARAYTDREIVIHRGWHGMQDWFAASYPEGHPLRRGVPRVLSNYTITWNSDLAALEDILRVKGKEVACVIIAPSHLREAKEEKFRANQAFLKGLRELVDQYGILLIFDEVVTGFRISLGGAQEYYGVTPDLACFAKAMANGMPISALTGRKEVMNVVKDIFVTTTYGGECLSLAGALATIRELREKKALDHVWKIAEQVREGCNRVAHELGVEAPSDGLFSFRFESEDPEFQSNVRHLFLQEMARRGVLCGRDFVTYSHSRKDAERTIDAFEETLKFIKDAYEKGDIASRIRKSL
ncbi:MAG: aminotransferase class III-fold pyridoxal phosphate-dependent enzyme, partial [Nitrososphaerota archaeon]